MTTQAPTLSTNDSAKLEIHAVAAVWLPTNPPRPASPLLTEAEVVLLLRLDPKKGRRTVKHYVNKGMLKANRFGLELKYRLEDVLSFIKNKGEE